MASTDFILATARREYDYRVGRGHLTEEGECAWYAHEQDMLNEHEQGECAAEMRRLFRRDNP